MWCYPICSHKTDRKQILVENPYKSIQVCLCSLGDSLHVDRDGEGRGAHERTGQDRTGGLALEQRACKTPNSNSVRQLFRHTALH